MQDTSTLATFRIDADTWKEFKDAAQAQGTTASALLKGFVSSYLGHPTEPASRLDAIAGELSELSRRLGELSAA
jgi:hypothetical protein